MKLRQILYIAPILLASCTEKETAVSYEGPIGLRTGFGTKASVTADAYKDSIPSTNNPLKADVWFSTTKDTYKGTGGVSYTGNEIDVHTTITYYGPTITVPDPYEKSGETQKFVHYPPYHGYVHCVGLYPQGVWNASSDGKTAWAPINGKYDLMYSEQMSGNDEIALSRERQLFNHELCWMKIRVRSVEHETAETWGKIDTIRVYSAGKATVDFSTGSITYSTAKSDSVKITAFESEGTEMPIMSTEFGNIMVSPTEESKYYVDIVCENHKKYKVEIPLTDNNGAAYSGSTKGKVFVLTLFFKTLPTIDFTATLNNFEDEGRRLEME